MGKIIYNGIDCGGGGGGTNIEPNPSGAATDTLEKLGIDGTVYDFEGTTYTAGTNIQIVNDVISATDTTYTAGTNIQITNNEISATDTTYSAFQGTDGTEAGSSGLVPAPAASDTNKYLKSDGTWATVSGGGGSGNVDDVYVNGTSVLDTNHIAQVTSYKELTQAQYDALPVSKYTDGILYCIKDTGINEGDKFSPIIYSTDEREVGTWTDGKPLYQKTIPITKTSTATLTDISSLNIENLVYSTGVEYPADKSFFLTLNYYESSNWYCFIEKVGNDLGIYCSSTDYQSSPYVLATIQYTKTTDVAGSGNWGMNGVPAQHISADEQCIGTYMGEPMYQKLITLSSMVTLNNTAKVMDSYADFTMIKVPISAIAIYDVSPEEQTIPILFFKYNSHVYAQTMISAGTNKILMTYTKN